MKTNFQMLINLLAEYTPKERGICSSEEIALIQKELHLNEMDILQLRNLRDFTVIYLSKSEKMEDWDRMSAITYVIDTTISKLGGEV